MILTFGRTFLISSLLLSNVSWWFADVEGGDKSISSIFFSDGRMAWSFSLNCGTDVTSFPERNKFCGWNFFKNCNSSIDLIWLDRKSMSLNLKPVSFDSGSKLVMPFIDKSMKVMPGSSIRNLFNSSQSNLKLPALLNRNFMSSRWLRDESRLKFRKKVFVGGTEARITFKRLFWGSNIPSLNWSTQNFTIRSTGWPWMKNRKFWSKSFFSALPWLWTKK